MAACELNLLFDKEDRCYCTNEPISGRVVVKAYKDYSGRDIRLDYGWRTHGWGNKDEESKGFLWLPIEDSAFRKREIREFPFRLPAQCEPLTYHGHYVNVDWYLKASLNPQGFLHLATHAEEDFLLIDRNMPGDSLPAPAPEEAQNKSLPLFWGPACALLLIFLMLLNFLSSPMKVVLTLGTLFGLTIAWIARRKIINFVLQRIIGVKEALVNPVIIQPGGQASCCLQFQANTSIFLDHITVVTRAKESSTSGSGTNIHTKEYTVYSKQTVKSYGEELAAGQWITFNCSVPIPANAPLTFRAPNNSIDWSVDLKITCKHWPSWEKNIPIIVASQPA